MYKSKLKAKSDLKKFAKLDGYVAECYSVPSFVKHLSKRFKFSEFELKEAVRLGKIRMYDIS